MLELPAGRYPGAQKTQGLPGDEWAFWYRDKLPHTSHPEDAQHLKDGLGCPPATPDTRHGGQEIPDKRYHPGETVGGAPFKKLFHFVR
jgi:hypothetical protein